MTILGLARDSYGRAWGVRAQGVEKGGLRRVAMANACATAFERVGMTVKRDASGSRGGVPRRSTQRTPRAVWHAFSASPPCELELCSVRKSRVTRERVRGLEVCRSTSAATDASPYEPKYVRPPVPVYVMLPLNVVTNDGRVHEPESLADGLIALKNIGVEGVMIDVWWGIVERAGPRKYDWAAYEEVVGLIKDAGLKVQAVMSFHACGANVGDVLEIPLPDWVLEAGEEDPDLFFTDQYGYRNPECISLWADNARTLAGRTPLEAYKEFMMSFKKKFKKELGTTLTEISVGCGPCGELRYPAYPENKFAQNSSQWRFPGIGEFQCYDKRALVAMARAASKVGHIEWGGSGPHDAGGYCNLPAETGFFRYEGGSWDTEYGLFFLSWYSDQLVKHGDEMLATAKSVFGKTGVQLAIKCAGVHWWYNVKSHPAELTAGYFNCRSGRVVPEQDGYAPIAKICQKYGARLNFTCVEMKDADHPWFYHCGPEGLLRQIRAACARYDVQFAGENALCRFDQEAFNKIIANCAGEGNDEKAWRQGDRLPPMACFTFLRYKTDLFNPTAFESFKVFVQRMRDETGLLDTSVGTIDDAEELEVAVEEISAESRVQLEL